MLYFFGDSWSSEIGELETWHRVNQVAPNEPLKSFPYMISADTGIPYKNFSVPGSSQQSMIHQLINSEISTGDTAIFCFTASSRRCFYNGSGDLVNLDVDKHKEALNEYQDSWLSALTCFTLYNFCVNKKIDPWFVNVFEVCYHNRIDKHHALWKEIPDSVWLLPKDTCLVHTEFDPEYYAPDSKNLVANLYNWLNTNNENVYRYIRPCQDHPNLNGRKKIAQRITLELKKKMKELQ